MKITRRVSVDLKLSAILYLLDGRCPPADAGGVSASVEGDGQRASVTDDNPLVLSWDEEVEL